MGTRNTAKSRVLVWAVAAAMMCAACGKSGSGVAMGDAGSTTMILTDSETADTEAVEADSPGAKTADADTSATEAVMLGVAPADPEEARAVGLPWSTTDTTTGVLGAGTWFSDVFSEPVAFRLGTSGRLVNRSQGVLEIQIGPPESPLGSLRIVEVVALSSPNGPIPISQVDLDFEAADMVVFDRGVLQAEQRLLSWRDFFIDGARTPTTQFAQECPYSEATCVDSLISESGSVWIELDLGHRVVAQDFGTRRLYVIATDFDAVGEALSENLGRMAMEIAASISVTDRTEDVGVRSLTELGVRADGVPAGTWLQRLGGRSLTIELDEDLDGVSITRVESRFVLLDDVDVEDSMLAFAAFLGFPDGVEARVPTLDDPLTAEEFLDGLGQIVAITSIESVEMAGQRGITWDKEIPPDSPFECNRANYDGGIAPDEACAVWTKDEWAMFDGVSDQRVATAYLPDVGMFVVFDVDETGAPIERFDTLLSSMTIS